MCDPSWRFTTCNEIREISVLVMLTAWIMQFAETSMDQSERNALSRRGVVGVVGAGMAAIGVAKTALAHESNSTRRRLSK